MRDDNLFSLCSSIFFNILKEPLVVQKQVIPHKKALNLTSSPVMWGPSTRSCLVIVNLLVSLCFLKKRPMSSVVRHSPILSALWEVIWRVTCKIYKDFYSVPPEIFFRVASNQIFFRVVAWKKLGVILINQKKIWWTPEHPEKNLVRCYPKKISGGTL